MKRTFILLMLIIPIFGLSGQTDSTELKTNKQEFLIDAVWQGLKKDIMPRQMANQIYGESTLWVPKCPICSPTRSGFKKYFTTDSIPDQETKMSETLISNLTSEDPITQRNALRDLIQRYVMDEFTRLKMTAGEIQQMKNSLISGRKQGMGNLNEENGTFCPSCDGACSVKNNE